MPGGRPMAPKAPAAGIGGAADAESSGFELCAGEGVELGEPVGEGSELGLSGGGLTFTSDRGARGGAVEAGAARATLRGGVGAWAAGLSGTVPTSTDRVDQASGGTCSRGEGLSKEAAAPTAMSSACTMAEETTASGEANVSRINPKDTDN